MFIGEYHHNLDEKNRIVIPTKYRELLGNEFIITRGIEKCLYIYSSDEWNNLVNKLDELPFTKKDARTFIRSFFSGANNCTFDKTGRIVISEILKDYASLKKECAIIGVNNRLEVWDKQLFDNFLNINNEKLEDIAEDLFEVTSAL